MRRGGKKRDDVEAEIVTALKAAGCTVQRLSDPDVPDLLVSRGRTTVLLECKSGGGRLSAGQLSWMSGWQGHLFVVRDPKEAVAMVEYAEKVDMERRAEVG